MAAAINADEVTPRTTFNDNGPVEVDEFKIRNSDEEYRGPTTMIEVINRSLNTGIAFITRKMGAQMLYEYLKNFGFGQFTDIEIDGEAKGQLEFWQDWAESELITRGFGQGFTASPLQVAMAYGALANGGYLMKPLLIEKIISPEGAEEVFEPERIRRIISEDTYQTIKAMLLSSVDNGVARGAGVRGHSVMGKTGTSQTYKNGKALTGLGTTITSFAGFGPYDDPQFVILVKLDHPKTSQWGSETAAGTFRRIATFLFDYYQIPPEE
jgi:cell division protein FtsI/penicillin-binding protein 2